MTLLHRAAATTALVLAAIPLSAQDTPRASRPVAPSDTVRLHEHEVVLVHGRLLWRDSTGLVVIDRRTRDTVHIPVFQITSAEVQRGSHRLGASSVGRGAAVGALIGGTFLGLALVAPSHPEPGVGVMAAGLLGVATTGIGTAIGTIVSFTHTETWVAFDPAAVPLQAASAPR